MVDSRTAIVARSGFALLGATAATVNSLSAAWDWKGTAAATAVTLVVVHGGLSVVDNTRTSVKRAKAEARQKRRDDFAKVAMSLAFAVGDECKVDPRRVGVGLFRVDRSGLPHLQNRRVARTQVLNRIERFRFVNHPPVSKVRWTLGKGAVGKAWETRHKAHRDWRPIAQAHRGKELTDTRWDRMKVETRSGFDRSEWVEMLTKYDEILAVPIKDTAGDVVGCLAIDIAASDEADDASVARLGQTSIEKLANETAHLLREYLT